MKSNGFTLTNMLLTLLIVSSMFVLSIDKISVPSLKYQFFVSDYLYNQAYALTSYQRVDFENDYSEYEIHFNEKGSVNQGQSFYIDDKLVVIRPSTGYIRYE